MSDFVPACIMIAEDRLESVKLYGDFLEHLGYKVIKVTDGREVFAAVQTHRPDMILMDIALPGVSGATLSRQIKDDPALKHIPILACTAFCMPSELKQIEASGVNKVVIKPFSIMNLRTEVEAMVPPEKIPPAGK